MFETGKSAEEIIAAEGLAQIQDTGEIERMCREVIEKNPDNVAKYRAGNEGVFKFFVGQVMKASRGQANPQIVNDTLKRLLGGTCSSQAGQEIPKPEPKSENAKEGDKAPQFRLKADDGNEISLADLRGKPVVLYFFPKAMTSGCTIEARNFAT